MDPMQPDPMDPQIKVVTISPRNRVAFWTTAVAALAVGGVLVVLGLTLLLALVAAGTVLGVGTLIVRRLTGSARPDAGGLDDAMRRAQMSRHGLDPSKEVFPTGTPDARLPPPRPPAGE